MGTPHKHAQLIKAWADGAEIQFFSPSRDAWIGVESPQWVSSTKYRIKPEPRKFQFRLYLNQSNRVKCWTSDWSTTQSQTAINSNFKQWLGPVEEREFDV